MSTKPGMDKGTLVITGTSRGIGYHLSNRFLSLGYKIVGISRSNTPIDHPCFRSLQADIGDLEQAKSLAEELGEERIYGVINNAGAHGPIGPFEETDIASWVNTFHVNLFGAAALTQSFIPSLRQEKGFIIFLSGGGSAFPRKNFTAYAVSKTGVLRMAETLALELAPDILVYCVAPGPNRTGLLEEAVKGGEVVPSEDVVGFEEVEKLCLFLANNRDPRFSGKFIHVKDNYEEWGERQLTGDGYTLRRIKIV